MTDFHSEDTKYLKNLHLYLIGTETPVRFVQGHWSSFRSGWNIFEGDFKTKEQHDE